MPMVEPVTIATFPSSRPLIFLSIPWLGMFLF
jgi:hypothetical protein